MSFVTYLSYAKMITSSSIQMLSGGSFCCSYSLSTHLRSSKGSLSTAYFLSLNTTLKKMSVLGKILFLGWKPLYLFQRHTYQEVSAGPKQTFY